MTTRLSKIARFPAHIREQLNRRLHAGELGKTILPWLNALPETKKILAELFNAKPVTHQNLSEWRHSGYEDWFRLQHRLLWLDDLTEQETEIAKNKCGDAYEAIGWHFLFEIGQNLKELHSIKNPERRFAKLQNLTRDFTRLQNAFNWSRRVHLEWDQYNDKCPPPLPSEESIQECEDDEEDEEYFEDEDENSTEKPATAEAAETEESENIYEKLAQESERLAEKSHLAELSSAKADEYTAPAFNSQAAPKNSHPPGFEETIDNSPAVHCRENVPPPKSRKDG